MSTNDSDEHLADEAFHKFLSLFRFLRQYSRQMDDRGISPRHFSVLRFLHESGAATVGEVQAYLYRSPSTTSTLVAQLEEVGFVTRTRSKEDNRVVIVELTPIGREIAETTPLGGLPLLRRRLKTLPIERLRLIDDALAEISQLMEVPEELE
jgi:DNA-binding MarR family transcriptional regulator